MRAAYIARVRSCSSVNPVARCPGCRRHICNTTTARVCYIVPTPSDARDVLRTLEPTGMYAAHKRRYCPKVRAA